MWPLQRMVWGSFLIAAAALKSATRNSDNAQGVNLTFTSKLWVIPRSAPGRRAARGCAPVEKGWDLKIMPYAQCLLTKLKRVGPTD